MYENVLLARDSGTLEQLKELSSKRKAVEESINENSFITEAVAREMSGGLTSRCEQVIILRKWMFLERPCEKLWFLYIFL